ncbi:diguanylate cyclase domain-containing protein [Paenibacillus ginsengarvi]|uniref:Diguanylate cyclase n=1 Tax=Paenibacillus ginsengarvi TaxID=400777 RepID=A0A3B0CPW9_9BACL|nr:diguanylate cyclase [Paenibacillus ginsengarvi]RKN85676.1 diguanylate cyclase [Paenibacillus ginsengarvi]
MKVRNNSLVSDIAFLLFLVLCMICVAFTSSDPNAYVHNFVFLNIAVLIAVITYFTNVTTGLVLNVVFLFGYGTFIVYDAVSHGGAIGLSAYFWMLVTPLLTVAVWLFTLASRRLQAENEELRSQTSRLATLDENTDLKNVVSFTRDVGIFAGLSARYGIPLTLLVIKIKYLKEIRGMIADEQLTELIAGITNVSQSSIRTNDAIYLLDKEDTMWGLLLFTDREGANIVMDRIRQTFREANILKHSGRHRVDLSLKMGALEYDGKTIETPIDYIVQAKKQLEYDV